MYIPQDLVKGQNVYFRKKITGLPVKAKIVHVNYNEGSLSILAEGRLLSCRLSYFDYSSEHKLFLSYKYCDIYCRKMFPEGVEAYDEKRAEKYADDIIREVAFREALSLDY